MHDFLQQKYTSAPPSIPLTINSTTLKQVSFQQVLCIIIDEDLTFTTHIEYITSKCKKVCNRSTLFPDMQLDLAVQIFKLFIFSKLEYGNIILGHT